jgi:addiction module HigA family antidote
MTCKDFPPIHPGEVLLEEFLTPMNMSQLKLALKMGVPAQTISDIVRGKRSITARTALLLARELGTSAEFWMGLQSDFDLETERDAQGEGCKEDERVLA